jgi:hypothetical protein
MLYIYDTRDFLYILESIRSRSTEIRNFDRSISGWWMFLISVGQLRMNTNTHSVKKHFVS